MSPQSIPTINCGVSSMPVVGLGTFKSGANEVGNAIETALRCGYRHIDCALVYDNEKEIGNSLSKVFQTGTVKREDVFVTGKLWNTYHRKEDVSVGCDKTLYDLQLDYLDLFLIHWPVSTEPNMGTLNPEDENKVPILDSKSPSFAETWGAMQQLVRDGKCKNIGLSNFNREQIEEILEVSNGPGGIRPACLQVESHPYLPNLELAKFCQDKGIAFVAFRPLGSPGRAGQVSLLEDEDILKIAEAHGKTPAQILIRYHVDRGTVAIPKSVNYDRIKQNIDISDFTLSSSEMETLDNICKRLSKRSCLAPHFKHSPFYPFQNEIPK